MSDVLQGFIAPGKGGDCFFGVTEMEDLFAPSFQRVLSDLHYAHPLPYCTCGLPYGERRQLHVHRLPTRPSDRNLTLFPSDASVHRDDCWIGRATHPGSEQEYDAGIFRAPTEREGVEQRLCGPVRSPCPGTGRAARLNFSRFAARALSAAQITAFVDANIRWDIRGFRQPRAVEIFRFLESEFHRPLFAGTSSYSAAAREGCRLEFGIVEEQATAFRDQCQEERIFFLWRRSVLAGAKLVIPTVVWSAAISAIRVGKSLQAAPYLFVAAVDARGCVRQLRLFAAATDGTYFSVSDSGMETAFAGHLAGRHCVFFKPLLRRDVGTLLHALRLLGGAAAVDLLYRPDFIVFAMFGSQPRCFVVEVRGFKPGVLPCYDEHLRVKELYFQALKGVRFSIRNGWEYDLSVRSDGDICWNGIDLDWLVDSEVSSSWRLVAGI